jgi:testis-specific serine kinase
MNQKQQPSSAGKKNPRRQNSDVSALERRGYRFGRKIGKGSYGSVVTAFYDDKASGDPVELACKYVDKRKAPKDFLDKFFPREIEVLTKISHPNIIGIHSILQSGNTVFIFMQWAENGDLLDFVKKHGAVSEAKANFWFFQMVSAIKYVHAMDYAHRDLKCENILISKHMNVKIADFGFARKCVDENNVKIQSQTFCGSAGKEIC